MDMRELLAIVRNSAVEPVQEAEGERPYICLYVKKNKVLRHECYASSSYEAAKKAATKWGLKSTAGVSAHLADIKHSTQHVGESESVTEDQDSVDAVAGAITRRIMMQHTDLLSKYGPVKVMAAIDDVADFAGSDGLDEIGSSDVSIWTKQVIQDLESGHFDHMESVDEAEEGEDVVDTVTLDVPLLLRMMEYAREDAQEDMDLHDVAERMIAMSKDGPLSMDDYDSIVGSVEALPAPEDEQIDELEKKTLGSYVKKASGAEKPKNVMDPKNVPLTKIAAYQGDSETGHFGKRFNQHTYDKAERLRKNRETGIKRAVDKLTKEDVEEGFYAAGPEAMPGAVGPQDNTNINFSQTKSMGDATVTVSANAKDMAELHKVLKLAGIEVDPGHEDGEAVEVVPVPDSEGEPCPQCGSVDCTCPPGECDCSSQEEPEHTNPLNHRYTTDKEALMGMLKDRLAKRLA